MSVKCSAVFLAYLLQKLTLNSSSAFSSECCPPLTSQHEGELETRHAVSASAISGFRREVDGNCVLLGYYAARSDNFLSTFRDNLSVASSAVKNPNIRILDHCRWDRDSWPLNLEPIVFLETSVRNYQYSLRNSPEERSSHFLQAPTTSSLWCDRFNNLW